MKIWKPRKFLGTWLNYENWDTRVHSSVITKISSGTLFRFIYQASPNWQDWNQLAKATRIITITKEDITNLLGIVEFHEQYREKSRTPSFISSFPLSSSTCQAAQPCLLHGWKHFPSILFIQVIILLFINCVELCLTENFTELFLAGLGWGRRRSKPIFIKLNGNAENKSTEYFYGYSANSKCHKRTAI